MTATTLRVADFSTHFTGPLCAHLLAELGADVIKIENDHTGDGNRELAPHVSGHSVFHAMLSSGARSLAVDRRSAEWPEIVAAASSWADVVLVAGNAATLDERGLGFAALTAHNERLIYCRLSAYGNDGPWADLPAHGQNMDAFAGVVRVVWDETGRPMTPDDWRGTGTTVSPLFATIGVLDAVRRRDEVDGPQCVDVSVWGSALWSSWRDIVCWENTGALWPSVGTLGSRYSMYGTSDGRALLVCPVERKYWEAFCDAIGLPERRGAGDWTTGGRMDFGAGPGYAAEAGLIQQRLRQGTLDEWTAVFGANAIPFAPVLTLGEVLASEHVRVQEAVREVESHGPDGSVRRMRIPRIPIHSEAVQRELRPAPHLGEHTEELRTELGLTEKGPQ
jgi:crotonobetainyl-CoA:carnitine CoA-transferase CaiB-like acyl-CoA transferase